MAQKKPFTYFTIDGPAPLQARLKVFMANWLYTQNPIADFHKDDSFVSNANGARVRHVQRDFDLFPLNEYFTSLFLRSGLPRDCSNIRRFTSGSKHYNFGLKRPSGSNSRLIQRKVLPERLFQVSRLLLRSKSLANVADSQDVPRQQRYRFAQPSLENDESALRCYNIIMEVTFYERSQSEDIFRTKKGDQWVNWTARICRGWTDPRDDLDVMHLVISHWGGWKRVLELLKSQAKLEVLWLKLPPEHRGIAIADGDASAALLSSGLLPEMPESESDLDDVEVGEGS